MIVGGWLPVLLMATASPAAETREEAVAAAREGRPEEGIAALRKLLAEGTDDPLAANDLAVILTWVNRPREATDAFERGSAVEVPDYVLAPIVRAYRDQKRFAEAEWWARERGAASSDRQHLAEAARACARRPKAHQRSHCGVGTVGRDAAL
jgi:hypothetical protein